MVYSINERFWIKGLNKLRTDGRFASALNLFFRLPCVSLFHKWPFGLWSTRETAFKSNSEPTWFSGTCLMRPSDQKNTTFVSFPVVDDACTQVTPKNDTKGSRWGTDSLRTDCMFSMAGNSWKEYQELSFICSLRPRGWNFSSLHLCCCNYLKTRS